MSGRFNRLQPQFERYLYTLQPHHPLPDPERCMTEGNKSPGRSRGLRSAPALLVLTLISSPEYLLSPKEQALASLEQAPVECPELH
jgi:hypothetical protein